jgi:glycosyltransferase involved in cell wall biosynthesis
MDLPDYRARTLAGVEPMRDTSRLSVALVTRNRPQCLARCLVSLRAQEVAPWEIVVSDDSDTVEAAQNRAIAEEAGARWQAGPRRGLYANRNAAALVCTGTHIRTMDDDHTFPPGHLELCCAAVARDPRAIWTCGERSFLDDKFHDFTERAAQLHPGGVACAVLDPDDNWAIADGATIYPREIFDRGERFLEDFAYGSSYLEFGALLYHRGWRSRCVPGAFIEHHADAATLTRSEPLSCLFASLCYNLHFRPNAFRAVRYAAFYARHFGALPAMLRKIAVRWKK